MSSQVNEKYVTNLITNS